MGGELEVIKNTALSTGITTPGLSNFPTRNVRIPFLVIGQPSNQKGYPEGLFVDSLTNESFETLDVVLMGMKMSRALWPKGDPSPGVKPLCKSSDARMADSDYTINKCPSCEKVHSACVDAAGEPFCEHAKWGKGKTPPECRLSYQLLVVSVETGKPYILNVVGKSLAPTDRLLSSFVHEKRPTYGAKFRISLKRGSGSWYFIQYDNFTRFETVDELKEVYDKRYAHIDLARESTEEDETNAPAPTDTVPF